MEDKVQNLSEKKIAEVLLMDEVRANLSAIVAKTDKLTDGDIRSLRYLIVTLERVEKGGMLPEDFISPEYDSLLWERPIHSYYERFERGIVPTTTRRELEEIRKLKKTLEELLKGKEEVSVNMRQELRGMINILRKTVEDSEKCTAERKKERMKAQKLESLKRNK